MPRYQRRYKRRYARRSTLSTRNIYANRSARSQAYQIAALKRRINYVSKQCKPEVKVLSSDVITDTFSSTTAYGKIKILPPEQGTGESQRVGNSWNVKNGSFKILINKNINQSSQTSQDNGLSYRVIIVQTVSPTNSENTVPDISDLLLNTSNNTECLVSPFKDGITAKYRIIKDVKSSTVSNEKLLNIRYNPFKHEELDPSGYQRMIYIYVFASTNNAHQVLITATNRYVFTDA